MEDWLSIRSFSSEPPKGNKCAALYFDDVHSTIGDIVSELCQSEGRTMITCGAATPAASDEELVAESWRGCIVLWRAGAKGERIYNALPSCPAAVSNASTWGEQIMQRRELNAPEAPPVATYHSQAVEASDVARTLYISGQVGLDASGKLAEDFSTQCLQTS